jgi:IclR family acetate operon transcriptional repressor
MRKKSQTYLVQPVLKALKVLEFVAERGRAVSLADVTSGVRLPKTTAFRYLRTLADAGFVTHHPSDDRYETGPRLRALSQPDQRIERLRRLVLPVMADLGRTFNETVNIGVPSQGSVIYIEMIESNRSLRMQARIGERHPLHSTALGKAILAHLPDEERALFVAQPLRRMTSRTVTDGAALAQQLRLIARRGFAIEVGENEEGSMCIGVPILDPTGYPLAAVSISAPERRMTPDVVARAVAMLKRGAASVTERMSSRSD